VASNRLRGWSRMVIKQFQDGARPLFSKSIYRHLSEKSSDFHEVLYTAANFELAERRAGKKLVFWNFFRFFRFKYTMPNSDI